MFFSRKKQPNIVTGLDIGSTAIRIAVGQTGRRDNEDLQIIGATAVPSDGIQKGIITNIDETVSSISHALEQVERLIGIPIDSAWVGMSGTHILSQPSKGVVATAKPEGEIEEDDVDRALEAARMVAPPLNHEVLHVLPRTFTVDGQTGIKNPVGMTGMRIEADTQIIYGMTSHIKNMTKSVYRTGIDIDDLVLGSLAVGEAVTTERQRELGAAVVDIGGSTTTIVVYESGDVIHISTIPIGSEHITNDLAIGLRVAIDVAERVKLEASHCNPKLFVKKDTIDLAQVGSPESEDVQMKYIAEIVEARAIEILEKVDKELRRIKRSGLLPAGIFLTGGGAKIAGLVHLAKEVLGLPATMGYPVQIKSISDKTNDVAFATTIGLVLWGNNIYSSRGGGQERSRFSNAGKTLNKLQDVWKSLIP